MALTKVFEDAFEDTDGTLITDHTPDTGTGWTAIVGNNAATCQIDDTGDGTVVQPYHTGAAQFNMFAIDVTDTQNDNQRAVVNDYGSLTLVRGVCVQLQDGASEADGYILFYNDALSEWGLRRVDEGSLTELGIGQLDAGYDGTTPFQIEIDASGNIETSEDGNSLHSETDTTHTGGLPGFGIRKSFNTNGFDDFEGFMELAAAGGRIMSSLAAAGGLVHSGGIAGKGGGLAG